MLFDLFRRDLLRWARPGLLALAPRVGWALGEIADGGGGCHGYGCAESTSACGTGVAAGSPPRGGAELPVRGPAHWMWTVPLPSKTVIVLIIIVAWSGIFRISSYPWLKPL